MTSFSGHEIFNRGQKFGTTSLVIGGNIAGFYGYFMFERFDFLPSLVTLEGLTVVNILFSIILIHSLLYGYHFLNSLMKID